MSCSVSCSVSCVAMLRGVFLLGFVVASLEEGQESPDVEGSGPEAVGAEGTRQQRSQGNGDHMFGLCIP